MTKQRILRNSSKSKFKNYVSWIKEDLEEDTKMKYEIYPVIAANTSHIHLNERMSLLVDYKNNRTKKLNRIQTDIVDLCNGCRSMEELFTIIQTKFREKYENNDIKKFVHSLIRMGYLHWIPIPLELEQFDDCDISEEFKERQETYFMPDKLNAITISVTEECCFKCDYCSQNAGYLKTESIPVEKVLSVVEEARFLGARILGIFGGEPLMYDKLEELIKFAYEIGYSDVKIFTKGTLIDLKKARKLRSIGIKTVQVSCDSCDPEKYDEIVRKAGSFGNFYRGMYNLLSVGIDVDLKIVVTKHNISEVPDMIDYFSNIGINEVLIEVVVPVGRANIGSMPEEKDIKKLENYINCLQEKNKLYEAKVSFNYLKYGKAKSCAGGIDNLMIFTDGTVAPCDKWYDYRHKFNFGNIYKSSLKEIWYNGNYKIFRDIIGDERCQKCDELVNCRGGCRLNSLLFYGDLIHPDEMCGKISGRFGDVFMAVEKKNG